ncbi:hypothetical protein AVEN_254539-1 [Araneus ventricosus]|uniref:Uncharacterized protein n=1 Tax=Araneus ventricosus TaxID=182803 RepID=A0A4Y2MB46_ARAVE|nr:hypothetical protein AVEN_254539-1 [Araneus ventricosus]
MNLRMWCWGPFEAANKDATCNVNIEQDLNPVIPVLGLNCECMLMIPEDQQSYIRSMSLCTLKISKVNGGFKQDPFSKASGREP